jgi:porphobilinogen deaminase
MILCPRQDKGILCIECLSENDYVIKKSKKVVHKNTEICGAAERYLLETWMVIAYLQ